MLGEFPERYTLEEKLSIIQAYKKGGGVQGLAEIIDDDEEEDEEQAQAQMANRNQGGQGGNQRQFVEGNGDQGEEDEDIDIDLDNPEDVKIIEEEFRKLYEKDPDFKTNFGDEAFELGALQKYQIIDAYNKDGMDAVLQLL